MNRRTPMKRGAGPRRKSWLGRTLPALDRVLKKIRKPIARKRRSPSEFKRIYGSRKRVRFVAGLPCLVCNATPCQNAHTGRNYMGYKADANTIVPLCFAHHDELHRTGDETFQATHGLDLAMSALETDALWRRLEGDA